MQIKENIIYKSMNRYIYIYTHININKQPKKNKQKRKNIKQNKI